MKKFLSILFITLIFSNFCFADEYKYSQKYLQNKNHFSISKSVAENIVKKMIKKSLKKEFGANFDVKFEGYTTSSIKKGIFKSIEITGKDVELYGIPLPYVHLKSITDYNRIDYNQNPVVFLTDVICAYDLLLSEESINNALKDSDYTKVLSKVNKIASPFILIKSVRTKIVNNKMFIVIDYNFPLSNLHDKSFVGQSDFQVADGKIKAKNVSVNTSYGNIGLNRVINLINYLNPLEFTLDLLDENKYNGNIENINIVDNMVKLDGKIYVKGKV